jgi:ABC-type multidrug transport system ATPase subunit
MNHGRLIAAGPMDELLGAAGTYRLQVDDTEKGAAVLRALPGVASAATQRDEIVVTAPGVLSRDLVRALVTEGIGVTSMQQESKSLEEAFLTMTEGAGEHAAR